MSWKKYKYLLLAGVILIILGGIFQNQIRQIATFLFGVTIEKAIDLGISQSEDFTMLIMGIGGQKHDGPDLTDTIIFANVAVREKRADLVSIPRDLWMDDLKAKINAIYAFGKSENRGIENTRDAVEQIMGEKVDYVLIIDFKGFVNLIDHLGGIEVNVEREFMDFEYPITGLENDSCGNTDEQIIDLSAQITTGSATEAEAFPCRYVALSFEKGLQTMDGQTALTFVRSRHGTNGEGSDFARSRRQQKIIDSLRNKILSLEVLLNPIKVVGAFNIIKDNIVTDINTEKLDDFVNLAQKMQDGTIRSFVLDEGDEFQDRPGLLMTPPRTSEYLYQYVLIPRVGNDNFSEIHEFINCIKTGGLCIVTNSGVATPTSVPTVSQPDR